MRTKLKSELEALSELSRHLISEKNLNKLLSKATSQIRHIFKAKHVAISMPDNSGILTFRVITGDKNLYNQLPKKHFPKGPIDMVFRLGKPRHTNNLSKTYRKHKRFVALLKKEDIFKAAFLPLKSGKEVLGVLCCALGKQADDFTPEKIEFLTIFANQIALAIKNAQMHIQLEDRALNLREQNIKTLRESDEKYKNLIELAPDAIVTMNMKGVITSCNTAATEISGYSKEELVGKHMSELWFLRPQDLPAYLRIFDSCSKGRLPRQFVVNWYHKDGTLHSSETRVGLLRAGGKRIGFQTIARDITERTQMVETLRTERDRLETVAQNIGVGLAIISKDYRTLWANQVLKQIFGEVEGKICYSTYNQRTGICPKCGVREIFKKRREIAVHEQVGEDKNGKTIWSQIISTPFKDINGNITAAMEVVVPITERKRAEEALRKSEEELRLITDALPVLISYVDSEQRYRFNNKAYEEWFGHPRTESLGKHIREILGQSAYKSIKTYVKAALAGQEVTFESFVPYKDGGTRYVNAIYVPHFGEQKEIKGFFALINDLTEHKQMDDALRASEEKLKNIFASIKDSVTITDLKGNIVDCNQAALDRFGLSCKKEALGRSVFDFIAPKERLHAKKNFRETLEQGFVKDIEYTLFSKDKKKFSGEVSASVVKDASGEPVGFVGITKDISERKKTEEALRKSKDLNTILRISYRISQVLELDKMLKLACEETAKALEIDRCAVVLVDEKEKTVVVKAVFIKSHPHPDVLGEKIVIEDFADLNKMYGKDPKILHLPMIEKAFLSRKAKEYFKNTMMKSLLIVPIEIGKKPLGYLSMATMEKEKTFTESDIAFVQTLANHLAIAIENAKLIDIVHQHSEDLKVLSSQVIKAQEEERKKIAGELHDEIGQLLTAMKINIDSLGKELPSELPSVKERIDDLREISSQALEYVRNMTQELRPTILDDFGLVPALNWHIRNFAKRYDMKVQLKTNNFECRIPFEVETILYRIAQEGLNNIAKHSQAENVLVLLERRNSFVFMKIKDDGIGFDVEKALYSSKERTGFGLFSIKERVSLLKGTFNLFSELKKGTRLEIKIPCPEKTRKEETYGQNKDSIS